MLSIWEACWTNYQTKYFHLFVSVAIVSSYGQDVWKRQMRSDEQLLFFTSLANHMDAKVVLKKVPLYCIVYTLYIIQCIPSFELNDAALGDE